MGNLDQLIAAHAQGARGYQGGRKKTATTEEGEFNEYILPRPVLHESALHGTLGRMAEAACCNSEAVPASVAIHILARFAATLGRTAYIEIGDHKRHLRMFSLIVGPTAKGRKGTSSEMPNRLFELIYLTYLTKGGFLCMQAGIGVATGSGICNDHRC